MGSDNTADKQLKNSDKVIGKPFPKGVSGNPAGRPPKGQTITDAIRSMMGEKPEIKKALTQKILQMALEGDIAAIRMLWNYLDGMPKQLIEINDPQKEIAEMKEYVSKRLQTMGGTIPQEQVGDTVSVDKRSG